MSEEVPKAIRAPNAKERAAAAKLTHSDLQVIDAEIFKNCSNRWLKVARVVSHTETALADRYPDLSYIIYTYRLSELVEKRAFGITGTHLLHTIQRGSDTGFGITFRLNLLLLQKIHFRTQLRR